MTCHGSTHYQTTNFKLFQTQSIDLTLYHTITTFIPFLDNKILDRSKLNQSADNNFKFHENSRKFSKQVENTVGKGEIARYTVFPTVFSKGLFPRGVKRCHCVCEWVKYWQMHQRAGTLETFNQLWPKCYMHNFDCWWILLWSFPKIGPLLKNSKDNMMWFLNLNTRTTSIFLKIVTLIFDFHLGRWPGPWYQRKGLTH